MPSTHLIPEPPQFTASQVHAWWTMDPTTHVAMGYCPQHRRNVLPNALDHEYGRQPSCGSCGEWLETLEIIEVRR